MRADMEKVFKLVQLGFDIGEAKRALKSEGGDLGRAEARLTGADYDDDPTPQALDKGGVAKLGSDASGPQGPGIVALNNENNKQDK